MKTKFVVSIMVLSLALIAGQSVMAEKPYDVGSKIEPFKLKDWAGNEHDLSKDLGKKVIVLNFWNCQCPVSRAYEKRFIALEKKYRDKGVQVYSIDSNTINDVERITKYAKESKISYPVLKDWNNVIADKFNAKTTPDVFVIGKDKTIHYHGAFDNSQQEENVKNHWLEDAVKEVLAGEKVTTPETKTFGCSIKRVKK